jgi:hypothetical protein
LLATNEHHLEKEFVKYHLHQMVDQLLLQVLIYLLQDHKQNEHEHITEKEKKEMKIEIEYIYIILVMVMENHNN